MGRHRVQGGGTGLCVVRWLASVVLVLLAAPTIGAPPGAPFHLSRGSDAVAPTVSAFVTHPDGSFDAHVVAVAGATARWDDFVIVTNNAPVALCFVADSRLSPPAFSLEPNARRSLALVVSVPEGVFEAFSWRIVVWAAECRSDA